MREQFDALSPKEQCEKSNISDHIINPDLTLSEVSEAIDRAKLGKAYLEVPNEALKNPQAKRLLYEFYSICFQYGLAPCDWNFTNIKPVENNGKPPRIPLNNCPIFYICYISKMYSSILNSRI